MASLLRVTLNVFDNTLDESMLQPFRNRKAAPLIDSLLLGDISATSLGSFKIVLGLLGHSDQSVDVVVVVTLVPDDLLDDFSELNLHVVVDRELSRIDDSNIHAVWNGVV